MVPYFAKFPTIGYDINGSGEKQIAVDILERIKIRDILKQNYLIFYRYDVKDGETPEMISSKLYGDPGFHWIILLANDIVDPYYDWPMSYDNLIATIRKKYSTPLQDGLIYAYETIYNYTDKFGNVIDYTTYASLPASERTATTVYLLDKSFVNQVDVEADNILKQVLV
jgi:Base plate wedge protein 53